MHLKKSPVPTLSSLVNQYVTRVVKLENMGARNTQTFLMSMVMLKNHKTW